MQVSGGAPAQNKRRNKCEKITDENYPSSVF
jgi:hypothetical protein